MSEKARVLLIVAVILGLALAVSSLVKAEECPPQKPVEEIEGLMEVSNKVLWSVVNEGGITFLVEEDQVYLKVVPVSKRVEEYPVTDPNGDSVYAVGVFANVFVGESLDEMMFWKCQFIAKIEGRISPNT